MASVIFGTNLAFAAKRWPEPEQWVRIVEDLGLRTVQFSFDLLDPLLAGDLREYDAIRHSCESHDIRISSAVTGTMAYYQNLLLDPRASVRARAEEWYRQAIDAAARLGADTVGGYLGACSIRQFEQHEERAAAIAELRKVAFRLATMVEKRGLECLVWEVQPVPREYPVRMEEAEELLAAAARAAVPIELCLDVGHACLPGGSTADRDPYAWLERFGSRARMVQLQQTDGVQDWHWPFTADHNAKGIIEPERVARLVDRLDREIELMLELSFRLDVPADKVVADVRESIAYWLPALDQARRNEPS